MKWLFNHVSSILFGDWGYYEQNAHKGGMLKKSYETWEPPRWRSPFRTWNRWMESRKDLEGAQLLWRVHDKLYDLSHFSRSHPGGSEWILLTKGTDITEAFEAFHLSEAAEKMLPSFYVREAPTPRNSPFTFKNDGFYRTLKSRVRKMIHPSERGPAVSSRLFLDFLCISYLFFCILMSMSGRYSFGAVAGFFLSLTTVCAHNFFHQRDNFRMYYFNLSLLSARDWRVTHALSHHIFPNSHHDMEIALFEPFLRWLPDPRKSALLSYASWFYSPIVYAVIFHVQGATRILARPEGLTELIPFIAPTLMVIFGGLAPSEALIQWSFIVAVGSFIFALIGLNAAHHHPELFHDGDTPREEKDWGLYQLDTVRDRKECVKNLPVVLSTFGDHTLHHMFPTLDHATLSKLYPVLEETAKEFGVEFQIWTAWELMKGQFLQLSRSTANPLPPK